MQKIRVLVVDDHTIVREGICALLGLAGDMEVVGEAANGREALDMVTKFMPDVVLMDIAMPIMGGLEATRRICKEFPGIKVLALTQYDDREYVFPAIEAGARGFVSKRAASSELVSGIRSVHRGDSFLSPSVARLLVEDYQQGASIRKSHDPYEELTDREREILKLLAEGYTTQEIADMLVISPKTVDAHKTSLMAKLDIHNRIDLVKYALRKGIVTV
ncbi:MAG: DNA-binding response regulator [Chloroflexi bacterium CG_4_9_14_3_um_filter_45_9]|nr:MAG: DNA-binding response regulator [Dehalococcoidia bacterium CG2_30_46_9]PIU23248.1 MAG: DNA-binding response regulator [Chloroflexi bacterium CG08_land_8_20_14_0_20_45_12]PIX27528.1 MAG: DNA-binding response regulator [Chloroflexi bacterium CG_4_8_14_3_um_filter_45_15]PJB49979.1 MAG: DNA-binding response regulator [Chloroflexi bacterium CG_4_9_14_3_um_filter_45_9]